MFPNLPLPLLQNAKGKVLLKLALCLFYRQKVSAWASEWIAIPSQSSMQSAISSADLTMLGLNNDSSANATIVSTSSYPCDTYIFVAKARELSVVLVLYMTDVEISTTGVVKFKHDK